MSNVEHPSHYNNGGIECIDALDSTLSTEQMSGFCIGNVIKYLWRYKGKGGIEDLKKARFYLDWIIKKLEDSNDSNSPSL